MLDKNDDYRATPSIQRYVVLDQTRPIANVFSRKGEDWAMATDRAAAATAMPEPGITLSLADIYEGVEFPPEDAKG